MRFKSITWMYFLCAAACVNAQEPAGKTRSISLDDAIRLALQQSLEIKLGYMTPQVAKLQYEAYAEGVYDPVFTFSASENYSKSPGKLDPAFSSTPLPGSEGKVEFFRAGFSGYLPSGATYDLSGSMRRISGETTQATTTGFETVGIPFQYTSEAALTVTQPLLKNLWIDANRNNIKVAKRAFNASQRDLEFTIMDAVHQVSQAYFDLLASLDQIKVNEAALQLKQQFLSDTTKKVQAGTLAQLDEKSAASDEAAAKTELIAARFAAQQAENVLKVLISDEFLSVQSVNLEPTEKLLVVYQSFNKIESWRTALEKRPDYQREKEVLASRQVHLEYTKNQLYPSLDLIGTYGRNGLGSTTSDSLDTIGDNRFPKYGGGILLTVPLTRKIERTAHRIQKINVENQLLQMKKLERDIIRAVDDAVKKSASAYSAIESSREARIFAEAALDAEQKKLENGKSTNLDVLNRQDALTKARSSEVKAIATYNKALYDVYFSEGTLLERRKISVEMK